MAYSAISAQSSTRIGAGASENRVVRNAERKALDALGLEATPTAHEVKTRFKALVKRHHPDANGGDRSSEDRLREIIQAYNYLKSIEILLRRTPPQAKHEGLVSVASANSSPLCRYWRIFRLQSSLPATTSPRAAARVIEALTI